MCALNAQNIVDEIGLFVGAAFVNGPNLLFVFRSFRATFISMVVVLIGVCGPLDSGASRL